MRLMSCLLCCALVAAVLTAEEPKIDKRQWATIKGQVVFPNDKPIPKRAPLNLGAAGKGCNANGPILDETAIVNPKNGGVKNVIVFLRPLDTATRQFTKEQIHPADAGRLPVDVTITQPCCMFVNRVTTARVGDRIVVENPAAIVHNFFWSSENNGEYNQNVASKGSWKMPQPLAAETAPIQFKCTVHPWMSGYVRIFDHPYFAITDEDGKFEIKNAPVGKFRIVYWHETGVRGGKEGRFGEPIVIAGPTMEMKPIDFDVTPK